MNPIAAKLFRDLSRPLADAAAKAGKKLLHQFAKKRLKDLKPDTKGQA